jgi:hypothetical protein
MDAAFTAQSLGGFSTDGKEKCLPTISGCAALAAGMANPGLSRFSALRNGTLKSSRIDDV